MKATLAIPAQNFSAANAAHARLNLRSLDALRGLLATYVLLGHARWLLWAGHAAWITQPHAAWANALATASSMLRFGHEAVMVFFVLSGFFIHFRAAEQIACGKIPSMRPGVFFERRAHRLLPPYALALLLTLALDVVGRLNFPLFYQGATGDALLDENFRNANFSARAVIPALFVLPSSAGVKFGTNGPLWSLAYEVVYYTIYPAWLVLRRIGALAAYGAAIGFAAAGSIFLKSDFMASVLAHYPVWLAGATLAEILLAGKFTPVKKIAPPKSRAFPFFKNQSATVLLCILISFLILFFTQLHPQGGWLVAFYSLGGAAMVCAFVLLPEKIRSFRIHALFEMLGLRSYTIYVCHFPMLTLMSAWTFARFGARPMSGWCAAVGALTAIAACCIAFEFCERHFLHARLRDHCAKDFADE